MPNHSENKLAKLRENLLITAGYRSQDELNKTLEKKSETLQQALAPRLRAMTIQHLRNGKGVVAEGFQGVYSAVNLQKSNEDFLHEQSKDGVWATYVEAEALGELLGCNVVVTYLKSGESSEEGETWCLYRSADDAPTIHLYNRNNTHWYVNDHTNGDGNCLYNAFAQALQLQLHNKKETPLVAHGMFRPIMVMNDAVKQQDRIIRAIEIHPSSNELRTQLKQQKHEEETRLSRLSPEERKRVEEQIQRDYKLGLKMAREELERSFYQPGPSFS